MSGGINKTMAAVSAKETAGFTEKSAAGSASAAGEPSSGSSRSAGKTPPAEGNFSAKETDRSTSFPDSSADSEDFLPTQVPAQNFPFEKTEGAIFDMDGTLIDSMYIWDVAGSLYLESRGIAPPPDLRSRLRTLSLARAAEYLEAEFHPGQSPAEITDEINTIVRREYETRVPLKSGVLEFLQQLSDRRIPMVIATATDRRISENVLRRLGIRPFFREIFSCPDWNTGKDRPLIFDLARDFLGTKKEATFVFEDALHAIATAKSAGYPVAAVYDAAESVNEKKIRQLCDLYCTSLSEFCGKMQK